jgi:glycosyltransferase-like protein
MGVDTSIVALGDPSVGFFRDIRVPHTIIPAPPPAPTLEERVFQSIDALAAGLCGVDADILHTQDCIAARAARLCVGRRGIPVVRTVHHVDDFTTRALIDCQRHAIVEPDRVLVVSEQWKQILQADYGVCADVVPNGVDASRFGPISAARRSSLRESVGAGSRFVFLAVGGIEPRKGSVYLLRALAGLRGEAMLVVVGGHSFQDYAAYREEALGSLPSLGLTLGDDVVLVGTLPDRELAGWYRAAGALAFPSLKEGWGLAVLEAMSASLPVIASDIPVFREYLVDGANALLVPAADDVALAGAMKTLMSDPALRARLVDGGHQVAAHYTWEASAQAHLRVYRSMAGPAR